MNLAMLDRNGLIELRNRAEAFVKATDGLLVMIGELKPEPEPMLMSGNDDPKPTRLVSQRRRSSGKRVKAVAPPASRRRAKNYDAVKKAGTATTRGSIYATCSELRERGVIDSYRDPDSVFSLWRVTPNGAEAAA